jgi:hypothetical protein
MSEPSKPTAIVLAISGLILNPSTFDPKASNGALTIANNVVIDRPSVVATRRGFSNDFLSLTNDGAVSMFQYNNYMLINTSDDDMHAVKYNTITGIQYLQTYTGSYSVPDPTNPESKVRGLETNKNFYFITEQGTYRLDHIDGQPRKAGAPAGLSGSGVYLTATVGFLPANTNVAYRVVFGYKDYNQQLILGAPSSRIIVQNTTGAATNVTLTFQIPKEIQSAPVDFFYQVYRGNASPNLATQPDDEMALCYEDICTGTATITIADIAPSDLLGAALYTNQGQDGILQSNYRPPWALDVCTFKQYAFYANTRTNMNADITLISAGALNGSGALVPGDTITFQATESAGASFLLTAVSGVNNSALGWFNVSNTGNPAYDIQTTAMNICLVANAYAGNTFLAAYYISGDQDLPGQMRFDRLELIDSTFTITSSRISTCWEQTLPITSVNDSRPNRIYFSKFNQPEAVPVVNYIEIGSANQPIRRIVPLRDGVMVMKDDGVFRISNASPPFAITPIDYNVRILAANTAAELDNKVYFLSDQGVVALSDSDAQIMSFVLDRTIIENTSPDLFPNLRAVAWGLSYQSDRKYILFMPTSSDDTQSTQQYVYNHLTQVWVKWTRGATCGVILKRDGKMYMGSVQGSANSSGDSYIYQERKSFTNNDYADNQYAANSITTGTTKTLIVGNPTLPPNTSVVAGWTVIQGGAQARVVSATVVGPYTTLVLDKEQVWAPGSVTLYTPILSEVQTIQLDCDNPAMNKQFSEIIYVFTEQGFTSLAATISSNTAGIPVLDTLIPTQRGGWGVSAWGSSPWGGGITGQGKIRRYCPQAIQRAGWLYVNLINNECFTSFGWSGLELYYKNTSTREK